MTIQYAVLEVPRPDQKAKLNPLCGLFASSGLASQFITRKGTVLRTETALDTEVNWDCLGIGTTDEEIVAITIRPTVHDGFEHRFLIVPMEVQESLADPVVELAKAS
jgi:hypothetical protein